MAATILERDMYSEAEAARLLRMPQTTLHAWLEGAERRGKFYAPVLRREPRGTRHVTWAEFIEAGLLRSYRNLRVPMRELRTFIEQLRNEFQVPYPLADRRPYVSGRNLVVKAQEASGLSDEFWLVMEGTHRQLLLTPSSANFLKRVEFRDDQPVAWRPAGDDESPVKLDPEVRGGRPSVEGISTEILWEHVESGEDPLEVASAFEVSESAVRWALAYENSTRAA